MDSGSPSLSSTNTLTIRVCDCDADGIAQTCNAEAYVLPAGLSTGALIAILACVLTLLGRYWPQCARVKEAQQLDRMTFSSVPCRNFLRTYANILLNGILFTEQLVIVGHTFQWHIYRWLRKKNTNFIFEAAVKINGLYLKLRFFQIFFLNLPYPSCLWFNTKEMY